MYFLLYVCASLYIYIFIVIFLFFCRNKYWLLDFLVFSKHSHALWGIILCHPITIVPYKLKPNCLVVFFKVSVVRIDKLSTIASYLFWIDQLRNEIQGKFSRENKIGAVIRYTREKCGFWNIKKIFKVLMCEMNQVNWFHCENKKMY